MSEKFLTATDLARRFNVKTVTIYAAAADGRLPCVRLWEGRRRPLIRFRSEDIEKLVLERTRSSKR